MIRAPPTVKNTSSPTSLPIVPTMQCSACGCACGAGGEVPRTELEAPLIDLEEGPCQCHTPPSPPPAPPAAANVTPETSWAGLTAAQEAAMDAAAVRIFRCIGRRDVMLGDDGDLLFMDIFFGRSIQSTSDLIASELLTCCYGTIPRGLLVLLWVYLLDLVRRFITRADGAGIILLFTPLGILVVAVLLFIWVLIGSLDLCNLPSSS
ncbi:hypothetical protein ACP4OV_015067 [Aristida adscensionis]